MRARSRRRAVGSALVAGALVLTGLAGPVPGVSAAGGPPPRSASISSAVPPAAPAGALTAVTSGLRGFDSAAVETQSQISCLSAAGYAYDMVNTNDTSNAEYDAAAAAGMKVVLFQGYYQPYWARADYGRVQGDKAAAAALKVKYPAGAQIFLNLENTTNSTRAVMLEWVRQWAAEVGVNHYSAGVYVGADQSLTAAELNTLPGVSVYWRSASTSGVPQVSRGYVQRQPIGEFEKSVCGTTIDGDIAGTDVNGAGLVGAAFPRVPALPTTPGAFAPVPPARILDTRAKLGGVGPVASNTAVVLQVTAHGGVPASNVSAVVLNVTVTAPSAAGYVTLFPTDRARPTASNVNFARLQTIANLVTVPVSGDGRVSLYNGSTGSLQLIADVAGYYVSGAAPATAPGTFVAITPYRMLDTRPAVAAAHAAVSVGLAGRGGFPAAGFDSAVLNVTATQPTAAGYLTAYPAGQSAPTASNVSFPVGQTVPGMVTVKVGGTGAVSVLNGSVGTTALIVDALGYYNSGTRSSAPGLFQPLVPSRILDTRSNVGSAGGVAAGSAISVLVRGRGGVPANASAVVLTATVTDQGTTGYLSVFPSDRSAPATSTLNFVPRVTIANQAVVPIGADGRVVLQNASAGPVSLVADVAGYFQP